MDFTEAEWTAAIRRPRRAAGRKIGPAVPASGPSSATPWAFSSVGAAILFGVRRFPWLDPDRGKPPAGAADRAPGPSERIESPRRKPSRNRTYGPGAEGHTVPASLSIARASPATGGGRRPVVHLDIAGVRSSRSSGSSTTTSNWRNDMKKTVLILFLAVARSRFGAFAAAQEKTPPPVRPAPPSPVANADPPSPRRPSPKRVRPTQARLANRRPAPMRRLRGDGRDGTPDRSDAAPKSVPVLRTELIKLKYADIETVTNLLQAYQSNFGRVSPAGRDGKFNRRHRHARNRRKNARRRPGHRRQAGRNPVHRPARPGFR